MKKSINVELIGEYQKDGKIYDVYGDIWKLSSLIYSIVERVSYKVEGDYLVTERDKVDKALITIKERGNYNLDCLYDVPPRPELPNFRPLYREISHAVVVKDFWWTAIYLHGKKMVVPKLAKVIADMVDKGGTKDIKAFFEYGNDEELIPIDKQIDALNFKLAGEKVIDYSPEDIKKLAKLYSAKVTGQYFNTDMLIRYYNEAKQLVKLVPHVLSDKQDVVVKKKVPNE